MSRSTSGSNAALLRGPGDVAVGVRGSRSRGTRLARPLGSASGRLEDAEQVLDAVVERERVALDVEEQVAGRRLRQHEEAAVRHERAVVVALGLEELVARLSLVLALDLDPRLLADALERRLAADPLRASASHGQPSTASRRRVATPRSLSARRWPRGDAGDERQVVVATALRLAVDRPSGRRRSARRAPGTWP